jgi:hypothetical protein
VRLLLDYPPEGVCIAIATRTEPPLPVARLRARGQLVEVDAGDLRFSLGETETFLDQVRLDAVARDEIEKAAELARGCPARGPRILRLIARAEGQQRPAKRLTLSTAGLEELSVRELGVLRLLASELTLTQREIGAQAVLVAQHGQVAHMQHLLQARRLRPRAGGRVGPRARADLSSV